MHQMLIARLLAGGIAGTIIAVLMMSIIHFTPRSVPKLIAEVGQTKIEDGLHEDYDWFGLLQTQWSYSSGKPNGVAFQYYPNGSLYRELFYVNGYLEGTMREYYENEAYRRPPPRGRYPSHQERNIMAGTLKAIWHYQEGQRHGHYELFFDNGLYKEEGDYHLGKRVGVMQRYSKEGKLVKEKVYESLNRNLLGTEP